VDAVVTVVVVAGAAVVAMVVAAGAVEIVATAAIAGKSERYSGSNETRPSSEAGPLNLPPKVERGICARKIHRKIVFVHFSLVKLWLLRVVCSRRFVTASWAQTGRATPASRLNEPASPQKVRPPSRFPESIVPPQFTAPSRPAVLEAKRRETSNPVTGLIQQATKPLAWPMQAYIVSRPNGVRTGTPERKCTGLQDFAVLDRVKDATLAASYCIQRSIV
jgi:hypothetical protein